MKYADSREFAAAQDRADPLAAFRERFNFPLPRGKRSPVYLCGNSLGLQPKLAAQFVNDELRNWKDFAVDGHFHPDQPWISYHRRCASGFAELTGSLQSEVVAMNTLTVNLHLLMASFYRPTKERFKIVIESQAFPSDRYAAASQLRMHGHDDATGLLEWAPRDGETRLHIEDLEALLDRHGDSVSLLLLPGVQYYTGQVIHMAADCNLARKHGCAGGLAVGHAIGTAEMALNVWAPVFSAWCPMARPDPTGLATRFGSAVRPAVPKHPSHCSQPPSRTPLQLLTIPLKITSPLQAKAPGTICLFPPTRARHPVTPPASTTRRLVWVVASGA